jgi:UDP-glucose 4-epimerase
VTQPLGNVAGSAGFIGHMALTVKRLGAKVVVIDSLRQEDERLPTRMVDGCSATDIVDRVKPALEIEHLP